ncbi:hypothetical protein TrVE_jg4128 [Triparma verrucosa]|uniref:Uncharacterized protein n=1 Tax=Triparma verrucosa TaxID=1606542 RepID=A0A9W7CCN6_9STRA|nr:hypothetical protein TrVE_jg4128 [Triparma verrucosa]
MDDDLIQPKETAWYLECISGMLLFLLVFGMSGTVDPSSLTSSLKNYKAILTGLSLQFLMLPFIGFLVVRSFELSTNTGVMVLVVASSPGGSYSNWWCSIFNAELSLSVTMTAISTVMSCVFLPLNLLLYAKLTFDADVVSNLNWASMFTSLAVVISAIFLGLWGSWRTKKRGTTEDHHKFATRCNKVGNIAGISLIVFSIILSSIDPKGAIWNRDAKFYSAVAAPCLAGLVLSSSIATCLKLKKPERVTLSIECCYQNVGIAQGVAVGMFSGSDLAEAIGVPLFYGFMSSFLLSFYCICCWKVGWTKAPKDESFCVIVSTNYELEETIGRDEGIEVIYNEEHMLQLQVSYDQFTADLENKNAPRSRARKWARLSTALSPRGVRSQSSDFNQSEERLNSPITAVGSQTFEDESTMSPTERTKSDRSEGSGDISFVPSDEFEHGDEPMSSPLLTREKRLQPIPGVPDDSTFEVISSFGSGREVGVSNYAVSTFSSSVTPATSYITSDEPQSTPLLNKLKPVPITTSAIFARKKILGIDVDPNNKSKTGRLKNNLNINTTLYEKSHVYHLTVDQREIIELLEGMITKIEIADAMMSLKDESKITYPGITPTKTI